MADEGFYFRRKFMGKGLEPGIAATGYKNGSSALAFYTIEGSRLSRGMMGWPIAESKGVRQMTDGEITDIYQARLRNLELLNNMRDNGDNEIDSVRRRIEDELEIITFYAELFGKRYLLIRNEKEQNFNNLGSRLLEAGI